MSKKKLTIKEKISLAKQRFKKRRFKNDPKIPIWERRGQTFEQYQKRDINFEYNGTEQANPKYQLQQARDAKKKRPDPKSISQLKIKYFLATGKKIFRSTIRLKLSTNQL